MRLRKWPSKPDTKKVRDFNQRMSYYWAHEADYWKRRAEALDALLAEERQNYECAITDLEYTRRELLSVTS